MRLAEVLQPDFDARRWTTARSDLMMDAIGMALSFAHRMKALLRDAAEPSTARDWQIDHEFPQCICVQYGNPDQASTWT